MLRSWQGTGSALAKKTPEIRKIHFPDQIAGLHNVYKDFSNPGPAGKTSCTNVVHKRCRGRDMLVAERHPTSAVLPPPPRWVRVTVSTVRFRKETTGRWLKLSRADNRVLKK